MSTHEDAASAHAARWPWSPRLGLAFSLAWAGAVASARWLGVWPAIGGAALLLGALAIATDRRAARALLSPRPRLALLGTAAGALMAAATILAYVPLVRAAPSIAVGTAALYQAFRGMTPALAVAALVPVVLGEELVWRGVVQSGMTRRAGATAGVLLTAALYAAAQAPLGSAVLVLVALGCGLVWSTLRRLTGSLVPVLVAHLLWDIAVLLWRPLDSIF